MPCFVKLWLNPINISPLTAALMLICQYRMLEGPYWSDGDKKTLPFQAPVLNPLYSSWNSVGQPVDGPWDWPQGPSWTGSCLPPNGCFCGNSGHILRYLPPYLAGTFVRTRSSGRFPPPWCGSSTLFKVLSSSLPPCLHLLSLVVSFLQALYLNPLNQRLANSDQWTKWGDVYLSN